jgi:hypothetical protein
MSQSGCSGLFYFPNLCIARPGPVCSWSCLAGKSHCRSSREAQKPSAGSGNSVPGEAKSRRKKKKNKTLSFAGNAAF